MSLTFHDWDVDPVIVANVIDVAVVDLPVSTYTANERKIVMKKFKSGSDVPFSITSLSMLA